MKTIKIEIELAVTDEAEKRLVEVARKHYCEAGQARAPVGKGGRLRKIPPAEFIPNAVAAAMDLVESNVLLEEAGVGVTGVSGCELAKEAVLHQQVLGAEAANPTRAKNRSEESRAADLDEFETGVYLCRWPNGDFSLVTANTRREALVELDEWADAHPPQLFPLEFCMLDFTLNDEGTIELKQFGEDTKERVWTLSYPELHAVLTRVMTEDDTEAHTEARDEIRTAVHRERARLWTNQPKSAEAETEIGKTLQKQLRASGPVADHYVRDMADRVLNSTNDKGGKPN